MKSRQAPSANVVRRARPAASAPQIVEVEPTPLEQVPAAIIPEIRETDDEDRDRIDIMGDITPAALPGVSFETSNSQGSSRPKKSLFAQQRDKKKVNATISTPSPSAFVQQQSEAAHDGILSDLIERDVISFDDHPIASSTFASHEHGFPETEKVDLGIPSLDSDDEETSQKSAPSSRFPGEKERVFYSSARDRLDTLQTVEVRVNEDEEENLDAQKMFQMPSPAQTPKAEFTALLEEISHENDDSMSKMTPYEVERLQQELASHLNPKFLMMLKERGRQKNAAHALDKGATQDVSASDESSVAIDASRQTTASSSSGVRSLPQRRVQFSEETSVVTSTGVYSIPSVKKQNSKTSHVNSFLMELERKKREWMLPVRSTPSVPMSALPSASSGFSTDSESQEVDPLADAPYMNADRYRFDFEGRLLSFPSRAGHVTVEAPGKSQDLNMLLHHGDEPTQPGYTLDELHHLARSAHPSQRNSAIRALGNIVFKAKQCYYSLSLPNLPRTGAFADFPSNLFLSHLMSTLGIGIALRIALDDASNTQILEALYALHALICAEADEAVAAMAAIVPGSIYKYPMKPRDDDNASLAGPDWDDKADTERCEVDLVLALLQTGILSRMRYLLESKPSTLSDTLILQIFLRMARHSNESCDHFRQCPGLLSTLKKHLSATTSSPDSPNAALLIKVVKAICEGSRDACQSVIENGLVAPCMQRLYLINLDSLPSDSPLLQPCLETLSLIETCVQYGFLKSEVLNIIDLLLGFITNAKRSPSTDRKYAIQTATWRVFSAMVPLSRDIPEGETIPGFIFLLSHVSPMVPLALASLRTFDSVRPEDATSDLDSLLASILEFLSAYFRLLGMHPPRNFEDEIGQVSLIAHNNIAPFLISNPYFVHLVNQLSSVNSWRPSPVFFNVTPIAPYTLSLRSHPTWSWKALRAPKHTAGGGTPVLTTEQNLNRSYTPNIPGSTLLHRSSVLLAALRVVSAVNIHDPRLSAALTASEISAPLSLLLERYSEWAMNQCSGSRGSVYGTRVLHLLAHQCISLLYKASIVAQAAGLVCLAHLMPGDEILAQSLIQRTTLYYTQEEPTDLPVDESLSKMLDIAPGTFAYLLAIINDGIGGTEPRSKRLIYLNEDEDHPVDRESLHMDVEASAQPLGKYWIYNAFSHYAKHRTIEENELAFKKQQAKSDAVKRGLEAHFKAKDSKTASNQKDSNEEEGIEDVQVELEGDMDLFGDYEDEESLKLLEAGRSLIRDSLQFALNVERSSTVYARHLKRSVKLNALMQVFTLGPKFWLADEQKIGNVVKTLLERFADIDWEPARLDRSIVLNTALIERVADIWANESFGDATIGLAISLWLSSGSKLTPPEIIASGQAAELKSVDAAIWPHFATLWHLLPPPPAHLQENYFSPYFRPLVMEYLLIAIASPHTPRMRSEKNFWYRFIIYQLGQFFVSKSDFNQNKWIRLNALQSLKPDLAHLEQQDQALIFRDIFELTRDDLITEKGIADKKRAVDIEKVQEDPELEYFLQEIRAHLFP